MQWMTHGLRVVLFPQGRRVKAAHLSWKDLQLALGRTALSHTLVKTNKQTKINCGTQ
jgi:hypothetical protein